MQEFIDAGLDTHDWAMFEPQMGDLPEAVAIAIETGIDAYRTSHPVKDLDTLSATPGPTMTDNNSVTRRGRFPDDGTLVLTETVGEWEEGLIFYTGIANWFLYDPIRDETTDKVDIHLLRELFDQGKLLVTERF